jgi:hypothetical protein
MNPNLQIDVAAEIREIEQDLSMAEGYFACENIITTNIKKHIITGHDDEKITGYLVKLMAWLEQKANAHSPLIDGINYRYAAAYVSTLLKMPYWKTWIKTND